MSIGVAIEKKKVFTTQFAPNWENKICSSITFFVASKNGLFMYWEAQKCLDGGGTVKKGLRGSSPLFPLEE